ncbi:hypothetical protein WA026_020397 [Henosepilachna vigintioctopunctata]|uniref:Proteasome assembly chaperone 2 n=1 Tax=Henosepilachna vigintioctopunctata TaxID=420089 RepID=A0AAW1UQM8_9CUCU
MTVLRLLQDIDLNGFTLIIPSVSVGNVPQLTVDLLIYNADFRKAGIIYHPAIMPSVGADPFDESSTDICTACELYVNKSLKLAVIQLRSALEFKLVTKFFTDLKEDIVNHKIANIIVLSAGFDYELHSIEKGKFFYVDSQGHNKNLEQIGFAAIEPMYGKYTIHGGGFSIKLFEFMKDICQCVILVKYVSEGDNRPDAVSVLQVLYKYIESLQHIPLRDVKFPFSWEHVFGGPPPTGLY